MMRMQATTYGESVTWMPMRDSGEPTGPMLPIETVFRFKRKTVPLIVQWFRGLGVTTPIWVTTPSWGATP